MYAKEKIVFKTISKLALQVVNVLVLCSYQRKSILVLF